MSLTLWTPELNERPRFLCRVCGTMLFTERTYERHVVRCAREHAGEIDRYRQLRRPDFFFGEGDPEYREWQKKTGKLQ